MSKAARHVNQLRVALRARGRTLHGLLVDMEALEYSGKQSTREMVPYLAARRADDRRVVFCVFAYQ